VFLQGFGKALLAAALQNDVNDQPDNDQYGDLDTRTHQG